MSATNASTPEEIAKKEIDYMLNEAARYMNTAKALHRQADLVACVSPRLAARCRDVAEATATLASLCKDMAR